MSFFIFAHVCVRNILFIFFTQNVSFDLDGEKIV